MKIISYQRNCMLRDNYYFLEYKAYKLVKFYFYFTFTACNYVSLYISFALIYPFFLLNFHHFSPCISAPLRPPFFFLVFFYYSLHTMGLFYLTTSFLLPFIFSYLLLFFPTLTSLIPSTLGLSIIS